MNPFVQPQEFIFGILAQNYFTDSNMSRHRGLLNNDAGILRRKKNPLDFSGPRIDKAIQISDVPLFPL